MHIDNNRGKISKAAVIISSLYLLAVVASFVIMLMTADDTPMSGIFLVLVTMPWSPLLSWIQNSFQLDSVAFNSLFLLAGGTVNSFILYKLIAFSAGKLKR